MAPKAAAQGPLKRTTNLRGNGLVKVYLHPEEAAVFDAAQQKHRDIAENPDLGDGVSLRFALKLYCKHFGYEFPVRVPPRRGPRRKDQGDSES